MTALDNSVLIRISPENNLVQHLSEFMMSDPGITFRDFREHLSFSDSKEFMFDVLEHLFFHIKSIQLEKRIRAELEANPKQPINRSAVIGQID